MKKDSQIKSKAFNGQRDGEEFLFLFRKHIIAMRKGFYFFLGVFAVSCLPVFFGIMSGSSGIEIFYSPIIGFAFGFVLFLYYFMLWHFSIYIVTDQRIRQIHQKGFFERSVVDIPLSKIQSINYNIPGFFADIFKFGTINILTIVGDLTIKNVEHPEEIYNRLQDVIGEIETEDYEE